MGDGAAGVLDRAAQFLARQVAVADDVDQYAAQWGVAFQLAEDSGVSWWLRSMSATCSARRAA